MPQRKSRSANQRYVDAMMRRINRVEADANATILRAITRTIATLEREKNEYLVRKQRQQKLAEKWPS